MAKRRKGNDVFSGDAGESQAQGWAGPVGNIMKDEFGLDIASESVPLPSKGVVYPIDSPLYGKETIEIRAMTAREEDILTSKALIKKGTVITELLRSCIVNKSINPDDLLIGDRNAIMTALRITGYGASYVVEVGCPSCGEKSKQDFNLSELPITRLQHPPVADGANVFECKIDDKITIRYRYLTGRDEAAITQQQERKRKQGFQGDNLITTRYTNQIVSVNDINDRTKISMFVQKMPTRISTALRKHMDENEPGIEMKSDMRCPHCFEESEVSMPLGAAFFWPES
ncbi:MAG: hypothetical protein CBC29_07370 [Methylococcaceae bacterium TMED69]|nr:MAG: hypothetical protein CBC29_05550 [Methylococcaceae bacterium TMED69]OUU74940.1 MAG: hypothetical protein CBC29_07370 [Methylococcaceae bacterium TMED69]|tara:strand:+ start:1777 stop:2634 length:858 start_codon:yes stop_codon:yes gene_type:complete